MTGQSVLRAAAEPVLSSLGLELVDIEVVGSGRARTLRLTVDRDGGIDLEVDGEPRRFPYDAIASARTVFEWGPAPKPIGPAKQAKKSGSVKERSGR